MLFSIYEFNENRLRQIRTFLMAVNQIRFRRVPWNRMTLDSKEYLGKFCVLCHGVRHLRSCLFTCLWVSLFSAYFYIIFQSTFSPPDNVTDEKMCWPYSSLGRFKFDSPCLSEAWPSRHTVHSNECCSSCRYAPLRLRTLSWGICDKWRPAPRPPSSAAHSSAV
jgi:hypothetical protein